VILLSLLVLNAALALGQGSPSLSHTANLTTIVFDPSGAVIPNAEITFEGEKTVTAKTGKGGSIELPLPYGSYAVTTSCAGFKTNKVIAFLVDTGKPVLKIVLQMAPTPCNPCSPIEGGAQTIASDLPNTIPSPTLESLPIGGGPMPLRLVGEMYSKLFIACRLHRPCSQTSKFHVELVPKEGCSLIVTNGDGRGSDEVSSYQIFLNGKRVLTAGEVRTAVIVRRDNTLKVVLAGKPHSKISILIASVPQ
jgi:hypothetical protein